MQFTTLSIACLSALATMVKAENAAAMAMTEALAVTTASAVTGADGASSTTTLTTTYTITWTVSNAHTVVRNSTADAAYATGGLVPSNSTSAAVTTPEPTMSDSPTTFEGSASSFSASVMAAMLGLGAAAFVAL